jgi:hypothetical protein
VKKGIFIVVIFYSGLLLHAQNPGYDITFNQIFDNREYFSDYGLPQTIFGSRIDAALCFELDSLHKFSTGLSYLYENGSSLLALSPQPILNYQYTSDHLKMAFGSFPRKEYVDLPLIFLNDTLNYYRSNIEGASVSYDANWGMINAFIDWTGRVAQDTRETFLVGLDSKLEFGNFYLNPIFLMYHNARSHNPLDSIHLQDNGMLSLLIGYDSQKEAEQFYYEMSTGIVSSYNRFRPDDLDWARGVLANFKLRYTIFGLNGVYYYGSPIQFEYGDPFYRAGNYGRLDFFIDPFANPNIKSKIGWNIHVIPGEGIYHSQQILISVAF